ncbi:MAG: 2OG-Fe(II) oxygenase [Gammaproteobacteria bacterium]|nr:MAG: 2OG-Fe(II) oxygenase [Gammaproteobacteria bacterium]
MPELPYRSIQATPLYEAIAGELATAGWGIFAHALDNRLTNSLNVRARSLDSWQAAGVGRQTDHQRNRFVRRDRIAWINGRDPAEGAWLAWAEGLRIYLNRSLMLGLNHFESHFAHYSPGSFYRRHLDAFKGDSNRTLSVVFYLNPEWQPGHGGELVLYDKANLELGRFPPTQGTLAVYLSEEFPHEVLLTESERFSIAGWFRPRAELPLENL